MAISKTIKLPQPIKKGAISLEEAISRRRSVRDFLSQPLSLSQVSQLVWAGQGITDSTQHLRAAASAGATYPLEIFVVYGGGSVEGLADGVYHYDIDSHSLAIHYKGDVRSRLAQVALHQEFIQILFFLKSGSVEIKMRDKKSAELFVDCSFFSSFSNLCIVILIFKNYIIIR